MNTILFTLVLTFIAPNPSNPAFYTSTDVTVKNLTLAECVKRKDAEYEKAITEKKNLIAKCVPQ